MSANVTLASLPSPRKSLVEVMRRLHYGQILGLHVRGGHPVFDPVPQFVRDIKLATETLPRPAVGQEDYLLKAQILELFGYFDRIRDGVFDLLEVKDGLPFRLRHAQPLS